MGECWDPRCSIPEHERVEGRLASALTDSERLVLRNALLANRDFDLTAAEATAVSWVAKPAVEAILHHRATRPPTDDPDAATERGEEASDG